MKAGVLDRVDLGESPRPRPVIGRHVSALILSIVTLLGLGAGAAFAFGAFAPTERPSPPDPAPARSTAQPTLPPPVEYVVSGPQELASRYDLVCGEILSPELLDQILDEDVVATDPLVSDAAGGVGIPMWTWIRAEGGLVCGWSNSVPYAPRFGASEGYAGIIVSVLPEPPDGWSERAQLFQLPGDQSSCSATSCSADISAGGSWISLEATDASGMDPEAWNVVVRNVAQTVSAAGRSDSLASGSASALPAICSDLLPLETVREITADPDVVEGAEGGGGWSLWGEARRLAGGGVCNWSHGAPELATLELVRGGSWAYDRMLLAQTAQPLELRGLGRNDAASLRCVTGDSIEFCSVDLRIGQDWVSLRALDREMAIQLATAVAERLSD